MRRGVRAQAVVADLALLVAVLAALAVGAISALSGSALESIVVKASATLVGVGFAGWLVALALTPAWFRPPSERGEPPGEGEGRSQGVNTAQGARPGMGER